MFKFKPFPKAEDFTCDRCRGWFQQETACSVANNWEKFYKYYRYCYNCSKIIEKEENQILLNPTNALSTKPVALIN